MKGVQDQHQGTTTYAGNEFPHSWMGAVRSSMVEQEAVFQHQLEELHRLYIKQRELMDDLRRTLLARRSLEQSESTRERKKVNKPKLGLEKEPVNFNEVHDQVAPVTPETARGKQVVCNEQQACREAAETLVAMSKSYLPASSDSLPSSAKPVTSVKHNAELASEQQPMTMAYVVDLPSGQKSTQLTKMPSQHDKRHAAKKRRGMNMAGACIRSWGMIKNSRRSERKRDRDPFYTFQRGALLCRWR